MAITISGNGSFTGATNEYNFDQSVGVAGTITYDDVTNIDSVGIITGRGGLEVGPLAGIGCTITTGGDITCGDITATSFSGSGSAITGISTLNITNYEPGGGGGGSGVDYQEFTSSGTWTKPAGSTFVYVEVMSGGGGGASGTRNATGEYACGGMGGGGARTATMFIPAVLVGSTVTITVGAGGVGGAAVTTDNTINNAGGAGGQSSFGTFCYSLQGDNGGRQNPALTSNQGSGYPRWENNFDVQSTHNSFSHAGYNLDTERSYADGHRACSGGGSGGAGNGVRDDETLGNRGGSGGYGFSVGISTLTYPQERIGLSGNGGSSTNGIDGLDGDMEGMGGGGGYTSSLTARGGNGGNGLLPGGGGGGGSGSRNGHNSGAGGNGGGGRIRVYTW